MTIYQLRETRIEEGNKNIASDSIGNRVIYKNGDSFIEEKTDSSFSLVHWNNSLHHMLNVESAVEWSSRILKPGGLFYMDDFIGSDRFQWPDSQLRLASRLRTILNDTKFGTLADGSKLPISINRPNRDKLIEIDPSEAADSENILMIPKLLKREVSYIICFFLGFFLTLIRMILSTMHYSKHYYLSMNYVSN